MPFARELLDSGTQPDMPDTITLKTGDCETFTVAKDVAMQSETIKNMLEGKQAAYLVFAGVSTSIVCILEKGRRGIWHIPWMTI